VTFTLTARGPGFARGTYTATVPILAEGIDNSPQNLAVIFRVLTPASIALSRNTVPMAGIPNSNVQETVEITNDGDRPLTGLATAITYQAGQTGNWLTAALSATSAPSTLTLTANTASLAVGSYSANVLVSSAVAGVAARNISVQLVVSPGPAIALSATTVNVSAVIGVNPAAPVVQITNGGGGTLSNLTLDGVQYTAGPQGGWLNPVLGSTSAPTTLTLNVASSALATGSYTATLAVRSSVASNSPVTLTVNLTVGPPPVIAASPSSLSFATWANAPSQFIPGAQMVLITNSGGGTLTGLKVDSVKYTSGTAGWLNNPVFLGGTTAPTQLVIRPQTAALARGTYTASIFVGAGPGIAPRTITVTYVIQTFTVDLYPLFGAAGCSLCHGPGQPPNMSGGTPSAIYSAISGYVVPGSPSTSTLLCKIKPGTTCGHSGGTFAALASVVESWIRAGAPQ
jgi:hypothetical protein